MNNFETIIGIEIHLELNTKTKMFSPAKNDFNALPNTCVNQIDMAYPGTLPLINKQAVISAIKLAKALKMEIDQEMHFDRKNYFYTDLPKGFQITQYYRPIGKNGVLEISTEKYTKRINIERIHLEEDTARQHHNEYTQLDYNRAGVPLIEIVTCPDLRSSDEAIAYVDMIRKIALSLNISDAKMENGSLRADINISLRPRGSKFFGNKVEIKNLNSFRAMKLAIDYEINFQRQQILQNSKILEQTKRFDESSQTNIVMRTKTSIIDYKYFPEPNIPFIKISDEFVKNVKLGELPWEKKSRYEKENIPTIFSQSLLNDLNLANYFDSINYHNREKLAKLFFAEIVSLANSKNIHPLDLKINNKYLEKSLQLLDQEILSGKSFKKLIPLLTNFDGDLDILIEKNQLKQISNPELINNIIDQILQNQPSLIEEYKNRPEKVLKQILGNIMKLTNGQANPNIANELVLNKLK